MRNVPNDPGMIEFGKHVTFTSKMASESNAIRVENFERYGQTRRAIDGSIHHSHASRTGKPLDLETAGNKRGGIHGANITQPDGKRKEVCVKHAHPAILLRAVAA